MAFAASCAHEQPAIAVFDLDRTLTRRATWTPFLWSILRRRPFRLPLVLVLAPAYLGCKLGLLGRKQLKALGLRAAIGGLDCGSIAELAGAFAVRTIADGLRPGALNAVERHRRDGDHLALATASLDLYVEPIARTLGIETVVCTRSVWSAGKLHIAGENCFGAAKLAALEEALGSAHHSGRTVAYSDDISDLPLLEWADQGVAVHPSRRLRAVAAARGIDVVDWQGVSPSAASEVR